eukprot:scaffold4525_cov125-Isochrysis_galbana.AAC.7
MYSSDGVPVCCQLSTGDFVALRRRFGRGSGGGGIGWLSHPRSCTTFDSTVARCQTSLSVWHQGSTPLFTHPIDRTEVVHEVHPSPLLVGSCQVCRGRGLRGGGRWGVRGVRAHRGVQCPVQASRLSLPRLGLMHWAGGAF